MRAKSKQARGFALVIVLLLLAILVLATYAIALVGKADMQVGTTAIYQTQARQAALMALRLALAELQRAAGRDECVTGTAGLVGVPAGSPLRQVTGVWKGAGNPVWLVSGNIGGSAPQLAGPVIQLVGAESVGRPVDRTDQELVEAGLVTWSLPGGQGRYAYWVGDEGVKISAAVGEADAQVATETGRILRLDARGVLGGRFAPSLATPARVLALESLRYARSGSGALSLTKAFHTMTVRHRALPSTAPNGVPRGAGYVEGAFNINATAAAVWRGLLDYTAASGPAYDFGGDTDDCAREIAGRIAGRGRPFAAAGELVSTGLLQDAFERAFGRAATMTAEEFVDDVAPILAVRSDTFRIRAYGEALNLAAGPAPGKPQAVAYCEALVQRTPVADPLGQGRKFVVVHFRWLGRDDL